MANFDQANGLVPISAKAPMRVYTTSAEVHKGDLLALVSGAALPFAMATHDEALGVAATNADSGDTVAVYDDPDTVFLIQVATGVNFAIATHVGNAYDVSGASGAMEIDLSGSTKDVLQVVGWNPIKGAEEVGAHARVACRIVKHILATATFIGDVTGDTTGTHTGPVEADTISEETGAAGVTVDGVKLKDSEVYTDTVHEKTGAAGVTLDGVQLKDSQVYTDQINEKTGAAGVTIDGVLLKDSEVTTDVINEKTGATGVTIDGTLLKDGGLSTADAGVVATNTINEKTGASGVTIDGVLLKDSEVTTDVINEKTPAAGVTADGVQLKDSQVYTDQINEKTGAAGVTIDGVLLKDSNVSAAEVVASGAVLEQRGSCISVPAALGGDVVLTAASARYLRYDPNGQARAVTLPAAAAGTKGLVFFISNNGTAHDITVGDGTLSQALNQNEGAIFACTGAAWLCWAVFTTAAS